MDRILIGSDSEVLVGRGYPQPLLPERASRQQAVVLTQPGAAGIGAEVAELVAAEVDRMELIELPDRDAAKELSVVGEIYHRLAAINLGRHDTVIGVGGGAVTDLAGFVAATWLRGIESIMVPTTLLAAVDASIGGKTGINLAGKNLVGAFWHPARVVVNLDPLDLLPVGLRLEGTAEILKAGLIADPEIVTAYQRDGLDAPLEGLVGRAIAVKAAVVTEDFREEGRRAILNFGHTIGHGVEMAAGWPHGLAVAVGMVAAAAVSECRYGFDRVWLSDLILSLGLPATAAGVSRTEVLDFMSRDKKRTAGGLRMVLLRAVGDPILEQVGTEELDRGLAAVGLA